MIHHQTVEIMRNPLICLLVALLLLPLVSSCDLESEDPYDEDQGPADPAALVGEWALGGLTDKSGDILGATLRVIAAGRTTSFPLFEGGQDFSADFLVDGLLVLTRDRYELALYVSVTAQGRSPIEDLSVDTGSYTVSGSTMTLTSDAPAIRVLTWKFQSGDLILEDEDIRLRFTK